MGPQHWAALGASSADRFVSITTRAVGSDGDPIADAMVKLALDGPGELDGAAGLDHVARGTDSEGVAAFVWWPPPNTEARWLDFAVTATSDDERVAHLDLSSESSSERDEVDARLAKLDEDQLATSSTAEDPRNLLRRCVENRDGIKRLWFAELRAHRATWLFERLEEDDEPMPPDLCEQIGAPDETPYRVAIPLLSMIGRPGNFSESLEERLSNFTTSVIFGLPVGPTRRPVREFYTADQMRAMLDAALTDSAD